LVGVLVYLGLFLLGVPYALLLAVLAAVFELIPLFGPILAAIPAILIAFVDGGIILAVLVIGLYVVIQQFESQVVYPLLVRKMVGISPIVVIIALIAGFQLAGFLGILLSAPVAAVIVELFKDYERKKHAEIPPSATT
jgi:predicted PurR-regulated permease PerM